MIRRKVLCLLLLLCASFGFAQRQAFDVSGLKQAVRDNAPSIVLAAGTYDLGDTPLPIGNGVQIVGAGQGKTVILTREKSPVQLFGTGIAIQDLTIRQASVGADTVLRGHWGANRNDGLRLERVSVEIGNGMAASVALGTGQVIRDCRFVSESMTDGAFRIVGADGLTFTGNFVRWRTGRCWFPMVQNSAIKGNAFEIDGLFRAPGRPETGGIELSYASNTTFENNRVEQTGDPLATGDNDGEMLGTQNGNLAEWVGSGKVVGVVGVSIRTDMRWGSDPWYSRIHPITKRKALFVLSGAAAGQWRFVAQGADGDVMPETLIPGLLAGDQVSLGSLPAYRLKIVGNTIIGGRVGISLYNGAVETEISGNSVQVGGIALRSDSRKGQRTSTVQVEHWPLWYCKVFGNALPSGYIDVSDHDVSDTRLPLAMYGNDWGGNAIVDPRGVVQASINETTGRAAAGRIAAGTSSASG